MNALFQKILLIKANTDTRSLYLKLKCSNFSLLKDKIEAEHLEDSNLALGIIIVDFIIITEVGEVDEGEEAKVVVVNMVVVTINKVILKKILEKEGTKENKINIMKIRGQARINTEMITYIEEEEEKIIGQESMTIMRAEVANDLEVITIIEEDMIMYQDNMKIERTKIIIELEVDRTLHNFKIIMIMRVTTMARGTIVKIIKATAIMMGAEKDFNNIEAKEVEQEVTQEVGEEAQEFRQKAI